MDATELKIKDNVVVPYPPDELKELKKVVKYKGVIEMIVAEKITTAPTVRRIIKEGKGQMKIVSDLREFVSAFKKAVA